MTESINHSMGMVGCIAMRMPSQKYSAGVEVARVVYGKKIFVNTPGEVLVELVHALPFSDGVL